MSDLFFVDIPVMLSADLSSHTSGPQQKKFKYLIWIKEIKPELVYKYGQLTTPIKGEEPCTTVAAPVFSQGKIL